MATVEVAFATLEYQAIVRVSLKPGMNAREAVLLANLAERHMAWRQFDFATAPLGIFGERLRTPEAYRLSAGERVEVYRPLEIDPKQARRNRAASASSR